MIYGLFLLSLEKITYMVDWDKALSTDTTLEIWHSCFIASFRDILNISLIEANLKVHLPS